MAEVPLLTQVAHWLNNEPVGMAISTSNLWPMMSPGPLRRLLQSLATLDAILCVEDDLRYHSFNANWGKVSRWRPWQMAQATTISFCSNGRVAFSTGLTTSAR